MEENKEIIKAEKPAKDLIREAPKCNYSRCFAYLDGVCTCLKNADFDGYPCPFFTVIYRDDTRHERLYFWLYSNQASGYFPLN